MTIVRLGSPPDTGWLGNSSTLAAAAAAIASGSHMDGAAVEVAGSVAARLIAATPEDSNVHEAAAGVLDLRKLTASTCTVDTIGSATAPTFSASGLSMPGDGGVGFSDLEGIGPGLVMVMARLNPNGTSPADGDVFCCGIRSATGSAQGDVLGGGMSYSSGFSNWQPTVASGTDDTSPIITPNGAAVALEEMWVFMALFRTNGVLAAFMSGGVATDGSITGYTSHFGSSSGGSTRMAGVQDAALWLYVDGAQAQVFQEIRFIHVGLT